MFALQDIIVLKVLSYLPHVKWEHINLWMVNQTHRKQFHISFLKLLIIINFRSCTSCRPGTYQYNTGRDSCYRCSSSSFSTTGSTLCTCLGKNRAFQPKDGWCVCSPGYEFVDSNFVVSSENDGVYDCQPIVYDRCTSPLVRNSEGLCVTSTTYCKGVCGENGGVFSVTTGTCQCNNIVLLDSIW